MASSSRDESRLREGDAPRERTHESGASLSESELGVGALMETSGDAVDVVGEEGDEDEEGAEEGAARRVFLRRDEEVPERFLVEAAEAASSEEGDAA
jgi:hypothetical protein